MDVCVSGKKLKIMKTQIYIQTSSAGVQTKITKCSAWNKLKTITWTLVPCKDDLIRTREDYKLKNMFIYPVNYLTFHREQLLC